MVGLFVIVIPVEATVLAKGQCCGNIFGNNVLGKESFIGIGVYCISSVKPDAGAPELYDPNGNMYIEYTLDYFLANAYAASEEAYNIDYYQYISPFVGRWLNSDGSGEGYYFYSDEYMTYAYADGAIEPLAWSCYLDESHSLVDNSNMTMFSLNNSELTDSEGDIVKINNEDGANTGYFEMVNPFTMNLFDNDGNRICRLSITGYRQAEVNGEETLFYYDDVPKG